MSNFRRRLMQSLKGTLTKISGTLPLLLTNAKSRKLNDYTIYGNTIQESIPTIDNPVEVKEVGELTNNILINNLTPGTTGTVSGVTYTVNNDLSVSLKGTLTGVFNLRLAGKWANPDTVLTLKAGKTYTLAGKTGDFYVNLYKTAVDGNATQYTSSITSLRKVTPTEDVNIGDIFIFCPSNSTGTEIDGTIYPICVEGDYTDIPEYEPYGKYKIPVKITSGNNEKKTNIYLNSPLLKIGDVCDTINFKSQKVYRNNYKSGFQSTADYKISGSTASPNRLAIYTAVEPSKQAKGNLNQLCKGMPCINWGSGKDLGFYISLRTIYVNNSNFTTVEEYKAWFDTLGDLKFYYELADAYKYEEHIILPEIIPFNGDCTFDVIADVKPSKVDVEYWR
jgi:hypothetical protein